VAGLIGGFVVGTLVTLNPIGGIVGAIIGGTSGMAAHHVSSPNPYPNPNPSTSRILTLDLTYTRRATALDIVRRPQSKMFRSNLVDRKVICWGYRFLAFSLSHFLVRLPCSKFHLHLLVADQALWLIKPSF
jgi:hypothetical protein